MNRLGKVSILCAALCVALAAMAVGAAAAKPHGGKGAKKEKPTVARLDPSFGTGGTTTVATPKPFNEEGREIDPSTHTAVAPSDKSYVLQGQTVVGFGADGKPDQKFGTHGRVTVKPGPGLVISVNGIAVDSRGRVLVAGTYEPTPGFKNPIAKGTDEPLYFGNSAATEAFVTRYLPTGRPDPTFGSGGTAITALGVPVPNNQPEAEKPATAEYERPIVTITAVGVDSGDRPVLAGAYVYAEKTCIHKQEFTRSIVARLTASGGIDTSFGNGGFSVIPGEKAFALARGPHGEWAAFGQRERGCYNDLSPFYSDLAVVSEAGT
ncbi:MAG TPA: hypothetical protein VHZ54_18455, partial [Solirubrobacterales bacterium]|nr:hypothetical protein [Solirubrobacterales bacterium]